MIRTVCEFFCLQSIEKRGLITDYFLGLHYIWKNLKTKFGVSFIVTLDLRELIKYEAFLSEYFVSFCLDEGLKKCVADRHFFDDRNVTIFTIDAHSLKAKTMEPISTIGTLPFRITKGFHLDVLIDFGIVHFNLLMNFNVFFAFEADGRNFFR